MLDIIFSASGSALYEIIKKISKATLGEEYTDLEKHVLDVFEKTTSKFFNKYGESFGKPNETFLARKENWENALKVFNFSTVSYNTANFNVNGFDTNKPQVTDEALDYFWSTFQQEIKNNYYLSKIYKEKQHIIDSKQFHDEQRNLMINNSKYKYELKNNLDTDVQQEYSEAESYDIYMDNGENALEYLYNSSLRDSQSILILGDYGSGKTTILKNLSSKLNKEMGVYTFFIPLDKYKKEINGKKLLAIVLMAISDYGFSNKIDLYTFEKFSKENKVVIILDGFDDLFWKEKNENIIQDSVNDILSLSNIFKVVISSRSHFFQSIKKAELFFFNRFKIHNLKGLKKNKVFEILNNLGRTSLIKIMTVNEKLCDLASRPILLYMIINTPEEFLSNNPKNETEIYTIFIDQWLERDCAKRRYFVKNEVENIMVECARLCIENNTSDIEKKDLRQAMRLSTENKLASKEDDLLTEICTRSLLVHSLQENCYKFAHRSFLEYFIGLYILRLIRRNALTSTLAKQLYLMEQVIWFLRGLMNKSEIDSMIANIKNIEGSVRTFLIVICRHLIETNEELRILLKDIMFSDPYFEPASRVETIYAIYKFSSDYEKKRLSEILMNNENDYLLTAKAQYGTSEICLEWARKRLSDQLFYKGREFLYFFPLSLLGDETDLERIKPFTTNNNNLISEQARSAINHLTDSSCKSYVW